jgi:hypothetical protein
MGLLGPDRVRHWEQFIVHIDRIHALIERLMAALGTGGEVDAPSQAARSMTRLKGEVRVCSGISPLSQLIN